MRLFLILIGVALSVAAASAPAPTSAPIKVGAARTAESKAQAAAGRTSYLGQPMVITGKTLDGEDFSTGGYKGKVVLVYFWASWCPDCAAFSPKLIKLYQDSHARGVEVVGISSDVAAGDLRDYLKKKPEMSWMQLYTPPDSNGRHPLNTTYNVDWIPGLFIIDREGICRSVDGEKEMTDLVPKLLVKP